MKIKFPLLKILLLAICISACKDKTDEPITTITQFCSEKCAIDPSQPYGYDTDQGTAKYTIPYPDKATITEISNKNNIITYKCVGGDYTSNNLQFLKETKTGLSKKSGDKLTIIVEFVDYDCNGTLAPRKKGSVIQGHPILLECDKFE